VRVLVTGGAGFIGSHLVDRHLADGDEVVVIDDLNTGFRANVDERARLVVGSIADEYVVGEAIDGCEVVFHQAAHKAVLRSIERPLPTDTVNTHGTLTLLQAALEGGVRRFVHESSSSIYGGAAELPPPESAAMVPRSPYAVSKLAAEHYCRVYSELHGLETVALRYFNVYGPRQRPDATYAAVIPLFVAALLTGRAPEVHGDGMQSRDFTYIDNVVQANLRAMEAPAAAGEAFNIACGSRYTLMDIVHAIERELGHPLTCRHTPPRAGDVRHTLADIGKAERVLGFKPTVDFDEGMARTVAYIKSQDFGRRAASA